MNVDRSTGESATIAAVRELAVRYAIAADTGDGDGFADVFLPDGRIRMLRPGDGDVPSAEISGATALRGVPASLQRRYGATFHLVAQSAYEPSAEVEGDLAGTVYCLAHHLDAGHGTDHVMHIRYRDAYRRDDDGRWRIATREGAVLWTETRPVDPA